MLHNLKDIVEEFSFWAIEPIADAQFSHHQISSLFNKLSAQMRGAELEGIPKEEILDIVAPVRYIFKESPFFCRIQTWPRGYVGDFETVEYVFSQNNKAIPNSFAWFLEQKALGSLAGQQHRNKVRWQANLAAEILCDRNSLRLLSIACGGSIDLRLLKRELSSADITIVLNDLDRDALNFSVEQLHHIEKNIHIIHGDAFRSTKNFSKKAPYDLILIGGLMDYLSPKQIKWLLKKLVPLLAPNGIIGLTNIGLHNPDRVWMEYIADWQLIERSKAELHLLIEEAIDCEDSAIEMCLDKSGLTHLVRIHTSKSRPF